MGGLACALALAKKDFKNIQVFETASNLGFVGAGIQLAPNMARILDRLGCWKDIEREAVDLKDTSIRRKQQSLIYSSGADQGQRALQTMNWETLISDTSEKHTDIPIW